MKGHAIKYSKDELGWVKACSDMPRAEMHAIFSQVFNRPDVSLENLKRLCNRNGWKAANDGKFRTGQTSHNAGKKGVYARGAEKTWFKKGNKSHTYRGHGHERIDSKDGYIVMIVDEPNPWTGAATRPVHKHRYLWEQANGPIPEGMCLKCLGEKSNTDPSNWMLIPRGLLPRLNGKSGRNYDAAPAELKPIIMATAQLEHKGRELQKARTSND